jgi:hypothetical protein
VVVGEVEAAAQSGPSLAGWPAGSPERCLAAVARSDLARRPASLGAVYPAAGGPLEPSLPLATPPSEEVV